MQHQRLVVSIDVVYDAKNGDLTNTETMSFWIHCCQSRKVLGILGGPPCETWCAARFQPLEDGTAGPRPLRSLDRPWGIHSLSKKERRQIELANALLRTQILFMHLGHLLNIAVIMERPAPATWHPQAPSLAGILRKSVWMSSLLTRTLSITVC